MKDNSSNIEYRFDKIVVLEFSFQEYTYDIEKLLDNMRLVFETGFKFHKKNNFIAFDLDISAVSEFESEESTVLDLECFHLKSRNSFFIKNDIDLNKEDFVEKNREFLVTLSSLSYSTSRGILKEKLSDTRYSENFLLPIIDPNQFVAELSMES